MKQIIYNNNHNNHQAFISIRYDNFLLTAHKNTTFKIIHLYQISRKIINHQI